MKLFKYLGVVLAIFGASYVVAQTQYLPIPSGVGTSGQVLVVSSDGNNVQGSSSPAFTTGTFSTSATIGTSGTALTQVRVYSQSLTTPSIAANTCTEEAVTVTGISSDDKIFVNPPAISGSASVVAARQSGSNTVALTYCNVAALSNQPRPGTYKFIAIRS